MNDSSRESTYSTRDGLTDSSRVSHEARLMFAIERLHEANAELRDMLNDLREIDEQMVSKTPSR